jgi:hypothetical protein
MAIQRNRVIYQSEALFISPDATGYHYTGNGGYGLMTPPINSAQVAGGVNKKGQMVGWQCGDDWPEWNPNGEDPGLATAHGTIIKQLKRVQSANYGFTVNKQDINQFGHLSRLDSIVIESPTVNLDFSYYLLDGYNERMLEFVTNGEINSVSGHLAPENSTAGNNFFILTTPESKDAVIGDTTTEDKNKTVVSLGNGYLTDYTVDISVGNIPTVTCTVEGMNIKSDIGETGINLPSINITTDSIVSNAWSDEGKGNCSDSGCTGLFSLPPAQSGYNGCESGDVSALRPGDVVIEIGSAQFMSKQVAGSKDGSSFGSAHIQSCSINVPLARTTLQRLGSTFGFTKSVDVPMTVTMSISAISADLNEANLAELLCGCDEHEVTVTVYNPDCMACDSSNTPVAVKYTLRGARIESENFTSSIGDNKTVDLTFSAQIAGADDKSRGLFIYGVESTEGNNGLAPTFADSDGQVNQPFESIVPPDPGAYSLSRGYYQSEVVKFGSNYYKAKVSMNHYNG